MQLRFSCRWHCSSLSCHRMSRFLVLVQRFHCKRVIKVFPFPIPCDHWLLGVSGPRGARAVSASIGSTQLGSHKTVLESKINTMFGNVPIRSTFDSDRNERRKYSCSLVWLSAGFLNNHLCHLKFGPSRNIWTAWQHPSSLSRIQSATSNFLPASLPR